MKKRKMHVRYTCQSALLAVSAIGIMSNAQDVRAETAADGLAPETAEATSASAITEESNTAVTLSVPETAEATDMGPIVDEASQVISDAVTTSLMTGLAPTTEVGGEVSSPAAGETSEQPVSPAVPVSTSETPPTEDAIPDPPADEVSKAERVEQGPGKELADGEIDNAIVNANAASDQPATEVPEVAEGWTYYGGDEFNDNSFDQSKWGRHNNGTFGQPDGMIQTYFSNQITEETDPDGNGVLVIRSNRRSDRPLRDKAGNLVTDREGKTIDGWDSGAFNSSGKYAENKPEVYFPLYSRVDVRAKLANDVGLWHGPWLTHFNGAPTAELDLSEMFAARDGLGKSTQSIHLHDNETGKLGTNLPWLGWGGHTFEVSNPAEEYHVYSVSIEPKFDGQGNRINEAIITFYIDNVVTYSFETDQQGADRYNKFIKDALEVQEDGTTREMSAWNFLFTGGIGKWNENPDRSGINVGMPADDLTSAESRIDYIRVSVPSAKPAVTPSPEATPLNPVTPAPEGTPADLPIDGRVSAPARVDSDSGSAIDPVNSTTGRIPASSRELSFVPSQNFIPDSQQRLANGGGSTKAQLPKTG